MAPSAAVPSSASLRCSPRSPRPGHPGRWGPSPSLRTASSERQQTLRPGRYSAAAKPRASGARACPARLKRRECCPIIVRARRGGGSGRLQSRRAQRCSAPAVRPYIRSSPPCARSAHCIVLVARVAPPAPLPTRDARQPIRTTPPTHSRANSAAVPAKATLAKRRSCVYPTRWAPGSYASH